MVRNSWNCCYSNMLDKKIRFRHIFYSDVSSWRHPWVQLALRSPLGPTFIDFWSIWEVPTLLGVIYAPVGALLVIFGPLDRLLKGRGPTFESNIVEKLVFAILMPRSSETTTFEGLAA